MKENKPFEENSIIYVIIFYEIGPIIFLSSTFDHNLQNIVGHSFYDCFSLDNLNDKPKLIFGEKQKLVSKNSNQVFKGVFTKIGEEIIFQGVKVKEFSDKILSPSQSKSINENKEYWNGTILSVSKFPSENPNPVFRIGFDSTLLYGNRAYLQILCEINDGKIEMNEQIISLHSVCMELKKNGEREIFIDGKMFLFQWSIINEEHYVNYYVKDVTKKFHASQEAEIRLLRTVALLKKLNGAVLIENEKNEIILWNNKIFDVFNVSKSKFIKGDNRKKNEVFSSEDIKSMFDLPDSAQSYYSEEIELDNKKIYNREYIPIHINNLYMGCLWKFNDITKEKHIEQELINAKNVAQRSLAFKSNFLSNMSHEIRTPMNGIIGMSELIKKRTLNAEIEEYVDHISSCSRNLLTIINDILDLSKMESSKLNLEQIPFSLHAVCLEAKNTVAYMLNKKNIKLIYHENTALNCYDLIGDPIRLNQILINLLSNAIKFTNKGSVELLIDYKKTTDLEVQVKISVKDTGIGISLEHQENIFNTFEQAQSGTSRKYGGTGLGLSICKMLCDLHNGTIHLKSKERIGSTFTVGLPYQIKEAKRHAHKTGGSLQMFNGLKILVVDDAPINRLYASRILEGFGCEIICAENGIEAIDTLNNEKFDIIFMDIQMPKMDGYQATETIRKKLFLDVPIIALTANAMSGEESKCLSHGMTGYLSKPFYEKEMNEVLKAFSIDKVTNTLKRNAQ